MHVDLFTRSVLLSIAVFLGVIAMRLLTGEAVQAQVADFEYVRYMGRFGIGTQTGNVFMNARTGELYGYGFGSKSDFSPEIMFLGRLTKLGEPLAGK